MSLASAVRLLNLKQASSFWTRMWKSEEVTLLPRRFQKGPGTWMYIKASAQRKERRVFSWMSAATLFCCESGWGVLPPKISGLASDARKLEKYLWFDYLCFDLVLFMQTLSDHEDLKECFWFVVISETWSIAWHQLFWLGVVRCWLFCGAYSFVDQLLSLLSLVMNNLRVRAHAYAYVHECMRAFVCAHEWCACIWHTLYNCSMSWS